MEGSIDEQDFEVFIEYGWTMLVVQLFEIALLQLVQMNQPELPEEASFDEGWKRVEPLFRMTAGRLRKELQKQDSVPDDILEEIQTAVNTRNTLAHEYLVSYRFHRNIGHTTPQEIVEELNRIRELFQELSAKLDVLAHRLAEQRGWDLDDLGGLTAEDLRRIASEVEDGEDAG